MKLPAGTTTSSGHSAQSRNFFPGGHFGVSTASAPVPAAAFAPADASADVPATVSPTAAALPPAAASSLNNAFNAPV